MTGWPVTAAAIRSMSSGLGSGRPMYHHLDERQRSMPSMAP